jgi:hypothetical protein
MNIRDAITPAVLAKYRPLIYGFITHKITSPEFEDSYLRRFKIETEALGQGIFARFRLVAGVEQPELI